MRSCKKNYLLTEIISCLEKLTHQYEGLTIILTGSFSTQSATLGSDVDILIFVGSQTEKDVAHAFKKIINTNDPLIMKKLDCKVLSKKSVPRYTHIDYLFLLSSLQEGTVLFGSPINLKMAPTKLRDALIFVEKQLQEVKQEITLRQNYEINAFLLFSITKSLYYMERTISQSRRKKALKEILPNKHFHHLARVYEKLTVKGTQSGLNIRLTKRGQKSGNYKTLSKEWECVENYLQAIKDRFFVWFDVRN